MQHQASVDMKGWFRGVFPRARGGQSPQGLTLLPGAHHAICLSHPGQGAPATLHRSQPLRVVFVTDSSFTKV